MRAYIHLRYIKNKPHKWDYTFFVIAGVSGIISDFIPYQGSATSTELKGTKHKLTEYECSLSVGVLFVISLCKSLSDQANSVVYFDIYFSRLPLFIYLKLNMNIRSLGTFCSNRIARCPIEANKSDISPERIDMHIGLPIQQREGAGIARQEYLV